MSINHLNIEQATSSIEVVSSSVIDKLYELAQNPSLDSGSNVQGNLQVVHAYEDAVSYLLNKFPGLQINVTGGAYIRFADPNVASICATNWGNGTGITAAQAAVVSSIGTVFQGNTEITSFNELFSKFNNVIEIGNTAFINCEKLVNIDTRRIQKITGQMAFYGCTSLKKIDLSNCTYIGHEPFDGCSSLESIGDTSKVEYIGQYGVFNNCISLKIDLNFPKLKEIHGNFSNSGILNIKNLGSITILSGFNFSGCKNLKTVILPETLISITGQVFNDCSSLLWIKLLSTTVVSLTNIHWADSTNSTFKIYVPDDLVDSYKVATNWSTYASRIFSLTQFAIDFPNG